MAHADYKPVIKDYICRENREIIGHTKLDIIFFYAWLLFLYIVYILQYGLNLFLLRQYSKTMQTKENHHYSLFVCNSFYTFVASEL